MGGLNFRVVARHVKLVSCDQVGSGTAVILSLEKTQPARGTFAKIEDKFQKLNVIIDWCYATL